MIIGLTGGIASGKSLVSSLLAKYGAVIIDADLIAREVVEPGQPALASIFETFGPTVRNEDGTVNRKKLGEIVFADPMKRKTLESIVHPEVRRSMKERITSIIEVNPNRLIVLDIPLLFESRLEYMAEEIVLVYVPRDVQIERLMERDKLSKEQAEQRLAAQMPIEDKRILAHHIIDNSGSREQTEQQVVTFLRRKGFYD